MASTEVPTSSTNAASSEEHKRTVDESFLNKMKNLVERLRLDNATLKKMLDIERSGVRALKAQQESALRNIKTEFKKKEDFLEKQLRCQQPQKPYEDLASNRIVELKKLSTEIQSLKAVNKGLQDKLKVAQMAECARTAELRAQAANYEAQEQAARRDTRAQCYKLLEEIKSKERVITQLQREVRLSHDTDQAQNMDYRAFELNKKTRILKDKERNNRVDLKTDIQHRKETFYREAPSDGDSAVSSAPSSLSLHQNNDMWSCVQCRHAQERADASARECAKLADALRDARDQLELMEFRLLELEDAGGDKGGRDNLTDSDSGCVSPGSRIKDSASPELKRMDSGYKSPNTPSSPCNPRRNISMLNLEEFKEEFAKAQVLADILDRNSETSDSLRSNPVKEHLEQMILNAGSAEDRSCLEQVLMLLYNYQAFSSSVSEDEFQVKPKRTYDLKSKSELETETPSHRPLKAIATVTPYSQQSRAYKSELFEGLCADEKKPNCILQESGIFEEIETESIGTQTDVIDNFECNGELNTEIQRLNSIREKLERQGRNRNFVVKEESDGLECRCVKLGKKHKQYYERRLKFLEGKISIYEAAQDVKKAKLAERLQKEFLLENRVLELENQLLELQEKYERLEEECCELEEIENDTRLHWQQLEMDYELCTAQLRDMTEQRECSRSQAERLITQLSKRECFLQAREEELVERLHHLEKAVPALIAWNVVYAVGAYITDEKQNMLMDRIGPLSEDTKAVIADCKKSSTQSFNKMMPLSIDTEQYISDLEEKIKDLLLEREELELKTDRGKMILEEKIRTLESRVDDLKQQLIDVELDADMAKTIIVKEIDELQQKIEEEKQLDGIPATPEMTSQLNSIAQREKELVNRITELERRETAYLEMLTQADEMWAEMENGYKKKIEESQQTEIMWQEKFQRLTYDRDEVKKHIDPLKIKIKEVEESESALRIALDKSERDIKTLRTINMNLTEAVGKSSSEVKKSETELRDLEDKFRKELDQFRKVNKQISDELIVQKENTKKAEINFIGDLDAIKKELSRSYKNNQDLETTNSELREEVESLEKQLSLTQKALSQCKRKCDDKIKTISHELSIKTEELEEMRSETLRQSLHTSRMDLKPDRTEYIDEGFTLCTAVPKKVDYGRMHHSMGYITTETKCSCPSMRSHLVGQLIEDLFDRIHNTVDDDLTRLCKDIVPTNARLEATAETKAKITNYLLMAISKELVRSIGDADAKTDTEEWQRAVRTMTYSGVCPPGNAGVVSGAARLASVSCACAAARLAAALPPLADTVNVCQQEVLQHSDVKIMEEQLANAIESIVNCPSCALGTNAIVWSTDV